MNVNGREELKALRPCFIHSKHGRKNVFAVKGKKYGSGKISRRVCVSASTLTSSQNKPTKKRRSVVHQELLQAQTAQPISDERLYFPNPKIKIIFEYWNTLGYPLRTHRQTKTKTTMRIVSGLLTATKHNEQRQIISAIELFHRYCLDPSFAFAGYFIRRKERIPLSEFIRYLPTELRTIRNYPKMRQIQRRHDVEYPESWLAECLKGSDYFERHYFVRVGHKDEHPEITELVVPMLERHQRKKLNERGLEVAVKFSKQLFNFGKLNNIEWGWLLDRIDEGLNKYHKIYLKRLFHITTDIFWSETLEEYLVSYDKHFMYRRDALITDRDKLLQ